MRRLVAVFALVFLASAASAQPASKLDAPKSPPSPAAGQPAMSPEDKARAESKLDAATSARHRKAQDDKLARTEAQWKKLMATICNGCSPTPRTVRRSPRRDKRS